MIDIVQGEGAAAVAKAPTSALTRATDLVSPEGEGRSSGGSNTGRRVIEGRDDAEGSVSIIFRVTFCVLSFPMIFFCRLLQYLQMTDEDAEDVIDIVQGEDVAERPHKEYH